MFEERKRLRVLSVDCLGGIGALASALPRAQNG